MAQRHDIINITFQANARGANAAIESLRVKAEECDNKVTKLRKDLKDGIKMGKSTEELQKIRTDISAAEKETRQWAKAYKELIKGMSVLDQGIKAFNDGSLAQMSAAFQKTLYNAAKLTRTKLAPDSETFKKDFRELTALMDATQQNFARLQGDAQTMLNTLRNGGKVSTAALNEELKAQRELLSVLSESDKGYKQTQRNVAELDNYLRKMGGNFDFIRENITNTKKVSDEMLRSMYSELEQVNKEGKVTQKIMQENATSMKEVRAEQSRRVENVLGGNLGQQSEQSIRAAIANAKELLATYKTSSTEANTLTAQIINAEEHLKTHGLEAARAAARETAQIRTQEEAEKQLQATMNKRLRSLKTLSADALAESRKYWEAQRNGAEEGTSAFKKAEDALKKIFNQERDRKVAGLDKILGDPSKFGIEQVRAAVQEMEKLRGSVREGSNTWLHYNKMVEQGKAYLDDIAKTDAAAKIASQMQNLTTTLSASGLQEVKRYWETMVAGAAHGSTELDTYKVKLEQVIAEEQRRNQMAQRNAAGVLGGDLGQYSEAQIREAIEAGKQLIQTYKTADPAAQQLAQQIVAAEQHLKQYGVEAVRTAEREKEALRKAADERAKNDALMKQQLQQGTSLSQSALKAQESYWQRLIDDPKTASASLQEYQNNLAQVKQLQEQIAADTVKTKGQDALAFFRGDTSNASADMIKQQTEALKKYRDSLPRQTEATLIQEIDSYILKTGESAKVAAGEVMKLSDAEALAGKLGTKGFTASTDQLNLAKKALVEAQNAAGRGTPRFKELQDAINKVDLELAKTGEIAENVQRVLDKPKGQSLNALKQAVEQGRAALRNMDRTTTEGQKAFDELAKKIKATEIELKQLEGTSKGTASAFEKAWSRLKTYVGLYVGAAVAMQKLTATMGDLMELSDKMGEVRKTTGFTADEVGRLTESLKRLDVRTPITGLLELSAAAGQMGLKTQEGIEGFTKAANMLTIALPEMGRESAVALMKIANATGDLKKNGGDVEETLQRVGSTIIALRANSASAAPAITDFVSRVGAVGAQAGISIDQIAALGSTIDALGGRVEMSATALSRMIPAIRNNAFGIAKAIDIPESKLTELFNKGQAMDAMVLIFEKMRQSVKQYNTDTEEGMNAMANDVEALLGKNASMAEVMKELNQQGARAGIVFGLLSQNVDELKAQLSTAGEAYKSNTALLNEFNNMNETTAAKWERLKNQVEEVFVRDEMQRVLGGIIEGLRAIVDFLTGNVGPVLNFIGGLVRTLIAYWAILKIGLGEATFIKAAEGLKAMRNGLVNVITNTQKLIVYNKMLSNSKRELAAATTAVAAAEAKQKIAAIEARMAQEGLNKAMIANVWMALAAAILWAATELYRFWTKVDKLKESLANLEIEYAGAEQNVTRLYNALMKANKTTDETSKKQKALEEQTESLRKEVDKLKKSTDDSAEAQEALRKKSDELEDKEKELKSATDESNKANDERRKLIIEINSKYSTYLGYMLSEETAARKVAAAHNLIVAALKEEMRQKGIQRKREAIDEKYAEDEKEYSEDSWNEIEGLSKDTQRRIMDAWTKVRANITSDFDKNGNQFYRLNKIEGLRYSGVQFTSEEELKNYLKNTLAEIFDREAAKYYSTLNGGSRGIMDKSGLYTLEDYVNRSWGNAFDDGFGDWAATTIAKEAEIASELREDKITQESDHANTITAAVNDINTSFDIIGKTVSGNQKLTDDNIRTLAENVNAIVVDLNKYKGEIDADKYVGVGNEVTAENAVNQMLGNLDAATRKRVLAAASKASKSGTNGLTTNAMNETSPYGTYDRVTSPYGEWDADSLVARRKEMLERVRALANGADVQNVLSEDAKFITEATRNNIKTTKDAIEWYNTERLKIQDALYEKHLTNTGDWRDPEKGGKSWSKQLKLDFDNYLRVLDAYYTERKALIEKAQTEEGMSEAEAQRLIIENETVWRKHRMELQQIYQGKSEQIAKEERQRIYDILAKQDEDSAGFVEKSIAKSLEKLKLLAEKSEVDYNTVMSKLTKGIATDLYKQQNAVSKQMEAIAKIVAQERPFDGLVENLQQNLSTMGVLFAELDKKRRDALEAGLEPEDDTALRGEDERRRRMLVLLQQAEDAYALTFDQLKNVMVEEGFSEWADAIENNDQLRKAMMAMLRKMYDDVHAAIKKESSQMKKELDIWWNDVADGQKVSRKGGFEKMLSDLGLQEDQVKRANSLIGAGQASERVADKLAIQQMRVRLAMQNVYYAKMRQIGEQRVKDLQDEAEEYRKAGDMQNYELKMLDAKHARQALNLSLAEEQNKALEQRVAIQNRLEESQNRLYTELKSWAELLSSSLQSVFEASHAGDAEYYNERAKLNLTGKGGPGAGTYIVIDNEGTSGATAHYEYLSEREALEREHEIERENARAEAWKKVWDDINAKLSETITDQLNAMLQNQSIDANTQAVLANTQALYDTAGENGENGLNGLGGLAPGDMGLNGEGVPNALARPTENGGTVGMDYTKPFWEQIDASNQATRTTIDNNKKVEKSTKASFAAMTAAANMYGIAYQAMSNENLNTAQKVEMMIVQAAGQAMISMLTASLAADTAETASHAPAWISKTLKELGPIGGPVAVGVFTALIGGLMGLATSKISKSKGTISQVTGASASAGRLATGMLTYAEGNVNEFTDPDTLTVGKQYNVDGRDGKTYRARYMGKGAKTHITNGPEFHLVGEAGREAIIDAKTTRNIRMNEPEIWRSIQTLYNGGSLSDTMPRRRRGIRAFAAGNLDEFDGDASAYGTGDMDMAAMQASLDRNSAATEALLERLSQPIKAEVSTHGPNGIVAGYDRGKKEAMRYGVKYT